MFEIGLWPGHKPLNFVRSVFVVGVWEYGGQVSTWRVPEDNATVAPDKDAVARGPE